MQSLLRTALSGAAALAISAGVQAQPAPDRAADKSKPNSVALSRLPSASESGRLFDRLDRNRDGYLGTDELDNRQGDWIAVDRDGDGRISRSEFRALR